MLDEYWFRNAAENDLEWKLQGYSNSKRDAPVRGGVAPASASTQHSCTPVDPAEQRTAPPNEIHSQSCG